MGCCGCDNKTSAITAGIFGLIQSIVSIGLTTHYLMLYSQEIQDNTSPVYFTTDSILIIKVILSMSFVINLIWFVTSALLLWGNQVLNVRAIRSWFIVTAILILFIENICLPIVLVVRTVGDLVPQELKDEFERNTEINSIDQQYLNRLYNYVYMLISFNPGGLITFITNICLCVFVHRRIQEIFSPAGFVVGTSQIIPNAAFLNADNQAMPPPYVNAHQYSNQSVVLANQPYFNAHQPHVLNSTQPLPHYNYNKPQITNPAEFETVSGKY